MSTTLLSPQEWWRDMLEIRGIHEQDVCKACGGYGVRSYSDTSTWRGCSGGQMITSAVCDKCWGSGDGNRPWPSHREFMQLRKQAEVHMTPTQAEKTRATRSLKKHGKAK